jgi:hypothetical protein
MILVTLETRNFTFDAIGTRTDNALAALHRGLRKHAEQYALPADWFAGMDVTVRALSPGKAYRDREVLK